MTIQFGSGFKRYFANTPNYNDLAMATVVYCAITGKTMPAGLMKSTAGIDASALPAPFSDLLTGIRRLEYLDTGAITVLFSSMLQGMLRNQRAANKDFKDEDVYDEMGV